MTTVGALAEDVQLFAGDAALVEQREQRPAGGARRRA